MFLAHHDFYLVMTLLVSNFQIFYIDKKDLYLMITNQIYS